MCARKLLREHLRTRNPTRHRGGGPKLTHGELYPGNEFNALLVYLILVKSKLTSMPFPLCMLSQGRGTVAAGHTACSPWE